MKTVAIIEGGHSHEEIISRKSAQTIFKNIDRKHFSPIRVSIDEKGWFAILDQKEYPIDKNDFSFTVNHQKQHFDFAFIVIHGTPGEDGKLQAYFDLLNIPYNTSSQLISTLTFNKFVCNQFLQNFGINVAQAKLVRKNESYNKTAIINDLGLPCFVKPADGGSSFGITKVTKEDQLDEAIKKGMIHGTQVIIESFLSGREVTNGIFLSQKGYQTLPITEIVTNNDFFDFDAKYKGESQEITPAPISEELTKKIKQTTKKVAEILHLKGIARIDYIIVNDLPFLIEVNTVPGMAAESLIPQMAALEDIKLSTLITEVITVNSNL
ncbi:MAG: D-alanine--D-alanine ligase [Flavobacteriales bacterium]|nr:D-alanine--D-alanine ligase [Flavobacteriales bacterium]